MDNEMLAADTKAGDVRDAGRGLPKGSSLSVLKEDTMPSDASERNGVFRQLVSDDADIAGLVAYSIYKQNKLDWLTAFEQAKGRAPNADELASYIIGEGTPRRLATYRHLAEATLVGNGPEVGARGGQPRTSTRRGGGLAEKGPLTPALMGLYALIAILFVVGFLLAAHYTMTSR